MQSSIVQSDASIVPVKNGKVPPINLAKQNSFGALFSQMMSEGAEPAAEYETAAVETSDTEADDDLAPVPDFKKPTPQVDETVFQTPVGTNDTFKNTFVTVVIPVAEKPLTTETSTQEIGSALEGRQEPGHRLKATNLKALEYQNNNRVERTVKTESHRASHLDMASERLLNAEKISHDPSFLGSGNAPGQEIQFPKPKHDFVNQPLDIQIIRSKMAEPQAETSDTQAPNLKHSMVSQPIDKYSTEPRMAEAQMKENSAQSPDLQHRFVSQPSDKYSTESQMAEAHMLANIVQAPNLKHLFVSQPVDENSIKPQMADPQLETNDTRALNLNPTNMNHLLDKYAVAPQVVESQLQASGAQAPNSKHSLVNHLLDRLTPKSQIAEAQATTNGNQTQFLHDGSTIPGPDKHPLIRSSPDTRSPNGQNDAPPLNSHFEHNKRVALNFTGNEDSQLVKPRNHADWNHLPPVRSTAASEERAPLPTNSPEKGTTNTDTDNFTITSTATETEFPRLNTDVAQISSPSATNAMSAGTVRSAGTQMVEALIRQAGHQVEVALNPEELGRVRIALTTLDSGINIAITAERPETLDLMRRYIEQLEAEFRQLGYENIGFEFSDGDAHSSKQSGSASQRASGQMTDDIDPTPPLPKPAQVNGVDIRL